MPSRLRGGVAVFIRRTIKIGVKIVDMSHTDLIWIKLSRKFFKIKKDLHIGDIYIIYIYILFLRITQKGPM